MPRAPRILILAVLLCALCATSALALTSKHPEKSAPHKTVISVTERREALALYRLTTRFQLSLVRVERPLEGPLTRWAARQGRCLSATANHINPISITNDTAQAGGVELVGYQDLTSGVVHSLAVRARRQLDQVAAQLERMTLKDPVLERYAAAEARYVRWLSQVPATAPCALMRTWQRHDFQITELPAFAPGFGLADSLLAQGDELQITAGIDHGLDRLHHFGLTPEQMGDVFGFPLDEVLPSVQPSTFSRSTVRRQPLREQPSIRRLLGGQMSARQLLGQLARPNAAAQPVSSSTSPAGTRDSLIAYRALLSEATALRGIDNHAALAAGHAALAAEQSCAGQLAVYANLGQPEYAGALGEEFDFTALAAAVPEMWRAIATESLALSRLRSLPADLRAQLARIGGPLKAIVPARICPDLEAWQRASFALSAQPAALAPYTELSPSPVLYAYTGLFFPLLVARGHMKPGQDGYPGYFTFTPAQYLTLLRALRGAVLHTNQVVDPLQNAINARDQLQLVQIGVS